MKNLSTVLSWITFENYTIIKGLAPDHKINTTYYLTVYSYDNFKGTVEIGLNLIVGPMNFSYTSESISYPSIYYQTLTLTEFKVLNLTDKVSFALENI